MSIFDVGDGIKSGDANWRFRDSVVREFDTHVRKSVPFYLEGQQLVDRLSDFFISDNSVIYDVGTSTGEVAINLGIRHAHRTEVKIYGLDIEPDMVKMAELKRSEKNIGNVIFEVANVVDTELQKCDFVVAFYTMQFIRPSMRQLVYDKIYKSLNWGGAFILFEKTRANDARFQDILSSLYVDYKIDQGYTPAEIIGKSKSLKGVLEPFSSDANKGFLNRAGFSDIISIFKYTSFEGVLAIK